MFLSSPSNSKYSVLGCLPSYDGQTPSLLYRKREYLRSNKGGEDIVENEYRDARDQLGSDNQRFVRDIEQVDFAYNEMVGWSLVSSGFGNPSIFSSPSIMQPLLNIFHDSVTG